MRIEGSRVLQGVGGVLLLEHCTRGGDSRPMGSQGRDLTEQIVQYVLALSCNLGVAPELGYGGAIIARNRLGHTLGRGSIHLTQGLRSTRQAARDSRP